MLYHIGALVKIIIGLLILTVVFSFVNVYQDYIMGLGFGFIGVFLVSRGLSFYLFYGVSAAISRKPSEELMEKNYKISLLIGLFILLNAILFVYELRDKTIGLGLMFLTIILQIIIFNDK